MSLENVAAHFGNTHTPKLWVPQTHIHNLFPYIEKSEPCFPAAASSGKLNGWRITVCKGLNTQVMHQTKAYSVVFVESWQDFAVIPLTSIWLTVDSKHSLQKHHTFKEDYALRTHIIIKTIPLRRSKFISKTHFLLGFSASKVVLNLEPLKRH